MNRSTTQPQILVIADDFTGSNDAGVSLALAGMKVDVAFELPWRGETDVLIVNSDSRALNPDDAATRVEALVIACQARTQSLLFKKMDSTLRGNPGSELAALLRASGKKRAVVAPAFPQAGRTTVHGQCLVRGVPVTQTEFASDPKTPVRYADICKLLQTQTSIACRQLALADYRTLLREPCTDEPEIWIVDAHTDACLDTIAAGALAQRDPPLLVGSAGLCAALARHCAPKTARPLLAVIGSMSEVAQQQIAAVKDARRADVVLVDIAALSDGLTAAWEQEVIAILKAGRHCIVQTCSDAAARHRIAQLCDQWKLDRMQLGERICKALGEMTERVINQVTPAALYLSGGDVATAVAVSLGASGFRITDCVAQCVPYGRFFGGVWQRPVMTKAGGFGEPSTLLQVLNFIEEKTSE
ncbi:four-carbon acid sugar kinase family protein [Salmonella enterica subsp. salamae]|nr:four-carbon acid sugar kinase family protein [Salmonella enterica subsp. salamae]ECJ2279954.1 four-carbon acid sugar kinase family protein [Salmonella enterica subsp. salamae]HCC0887039.1 four-carbon acid sugar kinase family protein [Salmonella enterica]